MSRFYVGDQIVLSRIDVVNEALIDLDISPEDYFVERDLAFVTSVNEDGSIKEYDYAIYYGYDEDGEREYELDEPEPAGSPQEWNERNELQWFTLEMLTDIKNNYYTTNRLDIICSKVLQLYRKHNNSNAVFKWKGI